MDKDHAKGAADKAVGKTKEAAGHVTGHKKLETETVRLDQVKGTVHTAAGDAKNAGRKAIDSVKN